MSFSATVTDADAYRAVTAWCDDAIARATGKDEVYGEASGKPIKATSVGYPLPDLLSVPRLTSPDTIAADDKTKLANYTQAVCRWFISIFASKGVSHSVDPSACAVNATYTTQITNTRGELAHIVTAWNNNKATIGAGIMSLPTAPAFS